MICINIDKEVTIKSICKITKSNIHGCSIKRDITEINFKSKVNNWLNDKNYSSINMVNKNHEENFWIAEFTRCTNLPIIIINLRKYPFGNDLVT